MEVPMMAIIYGYCRCSTNEHLQDITRQKRELYKLGVESEENIYFEYASGTKTDRIELNRLLNIVQPGDTISATEVSRLTRSTSHLCEIMKLVQEKHIRLIIDGFVVDCRNTEMDAMTKGMIMMWGVFSEMERDIISQRVKSGLENCRQKGVVIGRPQTTKENLPITFLKYYPMYNSKNINISEFARLAGCSRKSIYKYIKIAEE